MPKLAAFPKAFMDQLCVDGTMTVRQWIDLVATLDIDGLEFYSGFLEFKDRANCVLLRRMVEDHGLTIPMLCCSPDFTHPDPAFRRQQVDLQRGWIDMTQTLGGQYCRVLSGQRRPEVSREDGLRYAAEGIQACLQHAATAGVTLQVSQATPVITSRPPPTPYGATVTLPNMPPFACALHRLQEQICVENVARLS